MRSIFVAGSIVAALAAAGTSLGFAFVAGDAPQAFVQSGVRDSSRLSFIKLEGGQFAGFAGQLNLDYEAPKWKADYAKMVDKLEVGKRVRLGKNAWTRLSTDIDVSIGGAELKPGEYYLCAKRATKDTWALIAIDSNEIRKAHLDAFQSEESTGGVDIPLTSQKSEDESEELSIQFSTNKETKTHSLDVKFGPFAFTAPVVAKM